jgi:hypothetical protein
MKHLLLIMVVAMCGCKTTAHDAPATDLKAETDDRLTPKTIGLVDITTQLEQHVNEMIDASRIDVSGDATNFAWTDANKEKLLRRVYDRLGAYKPGTGIFVGIAGIGKEVSLHPEVVHWLAHHMDPEKKEIAHVAFRDTRYGRNVLNVITGKVVSHKTLRAANHSIAPVLNVRDVLLGTDKWGHFFMQGYWYWDAKLPTDRARYEYGQYMEGDPDLYEERHKIYRQLAIKWIPGYRFGYFGGWSTGVVSRADMQANEGGFLFYRKLFDDPAGYKFTVDDYAKYLPNMNEQAWPSKYAYDIDVNDTVGKGTYKLTTEMEDVRDLILSRKYVDAAKEADRILAKATLVQDFYQAAQFSDFERLRRAALFYVTRCADTTDEALDLAPDEALKARFGLPDQPSCP